MTSLWNSVRALGEREVRTKTGIPFSIEAINANSIKIKVRSGKTYYISRDEFDRAEAQRMVRADVEPGELRKAKVSEGNPAYVAGIIRTLMKQGHQ